MVKLFSNFSIDDSIVVVEDVVDVNDDDLLAVAGVEICIVVMVDVKFNKIEVGVEFGILLLFVNSLLFEVSVVVL
jgi:hypothetical protein